MEKLNVLWLKKDLRIQDHLPLYESLLSPHKLLVIYCFEPFLSFSPDFNLRQWYLALKSIEDLKSRNLNVYLFHDSIIDVLSKISHHFEISNLFAHQETGTFITYNRDREVRKFCKQKKINFKEYPHHGIWRGLKKDEHWKTNWNKYWHYYVTQPQAHTDLADSKIKRLTNELEEYFNSSSLLDLLNKFSIEAEDDQILHIGEQAALEKLNLFLKNENNFKKNFVPGNGKYITMEMSPYIALGNITIRQIYQAFSEALNQSSLLGKAPLEEIQNRLKWHCLTSQEFEMDGKIEYESIKNSQFPTQTNRDYLKAIKKAQTGYPFIDAILRCLFKTGHISFRQRSLLMSFACHRLKLPWQEMARFLAKHFIDYNPGVHYVQCQMQAGTLPGVSLRVYDPIKQSKDKDPHGVFIKKWIPELAILTKEFIHEPWTYKGESSEVIFKLGKHYPKPIDNHNKPLRAFAKSRK